MTYIYKITHRPTGNFYIGKTINPIKYRFAQHMSLAYLGKHHSYKFQECFTTKEDFSIELVETTEDETREQELIQQLRPTLNVAATSGYVPKDFIYQRKPPEDLDARINALLEHIFENKTLKQAAEDHKVPYSALVNLKSGRSGKKVLIDILTEEVYYSIMQYTKKTPSIFISPEGTKYVVTNKAKFAKEHNLPCPTLSQLAKGMLKQVKGWTCANPLDNKLSDPSRSSKGYRVVVFKDSTGKTFDVLNIARFAREKGLEPSRLYKLIKGEARTHKGFSVDKIYYTDTNDEI